MVLPDNFTPLVYEDVVGSEWTVVPFSQFEFTVTALFHLLLKYLALSEMIHFQGSTLVGIDFSPFCKMV